MKLTLSVLKTKEEEVHIEVPSFWRNAAFRNIINCIGIIDHNTVCEIYMEENHVRITNSIPSECQGTLNGLANRHSWENFQPMTEQSFLSIYAEALEAASLAPRLIEKESYVDDLASIGVIGKEVSHES